MNITIFTKDNKTCYSTGSAVKINGVQSKKRNALEALGWKPIGVISGRDMSGDFPTMTKVLQEAKDAKTQ